MGRTEGPNANTHGVGGALTSMGGGRGGLGVGTPTSMGGGRGGFGVGALTSGAFGAGPVGAR